PLERDPARHAAPPRLWRVTRRPRAPRASRAPPRLDPRHAREDQGGPNEEPGRELFPEEDPREGGGENRLRIRRDRDLRRLEMPERVHPQRIGYHRGPDREVEDPAPDGGADRPKRRQRPRDEERGEAERGARDDGPGGHRHRIVARQERLREHGV